MSDDEPKWMWSDDPDDPVQVRPYRGVVDDPVTSLPLPDRVVRALDYCDLSTVGQVASLSVRDLANVPRLGPAAVRSITQALSTVGLTPAPTLSAEQSFTYRPGDSQGHGTGDPPATAWPVEAVRELHDDLMWWPFQELSGRYVRQRLTWTIDKLNPAGLLRRALFDLLDAVPDGPSPTDDVAMQVCTQVCQFVHPDQVLPCRPA